MLTLLVALTVANGLPEEAKACAVKVKTVVTGWECEPHLGAVIWDDVQLFLAGGRESILGALIEKLEAQGKLGAFITRLERMERFTSIDGYQQTKWGMSAKAVRKLYPKAKMEGSTLAVAGDVVGRPAVTAFVFTRDRLTRVVIMFADKFVNANNHIVHYGQISDLLREKYGEPASTRADWSQSTYENDPQRWGLALSMGHVAFQTDWTTERTTIALRCGGEGFRAQCGIIYGSVELAEMRDEAERNESLDDL